MAPGAAPVMTQPGVSPKVRPAPTVQSPQPVLRNEPGLPNQPVLPPQPLDPLGNPQPIAIPGGPIEPGKIQPGVITKPLPTAPTLWDFAHPTATALGPTAAEVAWKAREGATGYRVFRNDVPIADVGVQTPSQKFLDTSLAPGSMTTYKIWAMQTRATPLGQKGGRLATTLEESQPVSVGTPAIVAPTEITATVISFSPNAVRLSWSSARGAVAYRVFRDNQVIQANLGAASIDDGSVMSGVHTYTVQSIYPAPNGAQILGAISNPVKVRVGPFNAIAVGDSVMWGQGLRDLPGVPHKFTTRVHQWLLTTMGKPVTFNSFAHSGAVFTAGSAAQEAMSMADREVPSSFPTISRQALTDAPLALARLGIRPADVDLVLVDGCINDIGVMSILDPGQSDTAIATAAATTCGGMASLLSSIHNTFPTAKIVLTGYWAIVSPSSDLTAVATLVMSAGLVGSATASAFGIPIDPLTGFIAGVVTSTFLRDKLVSHSNTFLMASDAALAAAANTVNSQFGGGWVSFVRPPYQHQNAYASPDSWLWLIPTDLYPKDEVFTQRQASCGVVKHASAGDAVKCVEASMGHPNIPGAQAYADAITANLASSVPVWRQAHATVQRAP